MTLQCLHLPVPSQWRAFINLFPDIHCFPSLRCLEAMRPAASVNLQTHLAEAVRMLSDLVGESDTTALSRRLGIHVLCRLVPWPSDGDAERGWIEAWNALGDQILKSNIKGFDVFGHVQVKWAGEGSTSFLGSYGPGASDAASKRDYRVLWEEGPCSGWQSAVPDVYM
ncbi:hypothetical protein BKA70DRAFT_1262324 [Coprinopsis sp. MPI-PUGE-AT-0042]|nr:hypothetical protein BKA70DRAFT_1262324 [Coprinopsis sp. MPI-PUGE-AT-0042]